MTVVELMRSLLSRTHLALLSQRVVSIVIVFLLGVAAVRLFGPAKAGEMFVVQAIWIVGRYVCTYGYGWTVLRAGTFKDVPRRRRVFHIYMAVLLRVLTFNLILTLGVVAVVLVFRLGVIPIVCVLGAAFSAVSSVTMSFFALNRRVARGLLIENVAYPLLACVVVVAEAAFAPEPNVLRVVAAQLVLNVIAFMIATTGVFSRVTIHDLKAAAQFRSGRLRQNVSLLASDIAVNLALKLPTLLTAAFFGTHDAAHIEIAQRFGLLTTTVVSTGIFAEIGSVSRALASGRPDSVSASVHRIFVLGTSCNVSALVFFWFAAGKLMEVIYGISDPAVAQAILVFAVLMALHPAFAFATYVLNIAGHPAKTASVNVISVFIIAGVHVCMVWSHAATPVVAAAVAFAAGTAIRDLLAGYWMRSILRSRGMQSC